jgi:cobaltochelatase CobN
MSPMTNPRQSSAGPSQTNRRVKSFRPSFLLVAFFVAAYVSAAPVKIALLCGDVHSSAALGAVAELQRDPALRDVTVRVFPQADVSEDERRFVRESDLIVGYTRYGGLLRELAAEIGIAVKRGAQLVGVGGPLDPEFADLGFRRDPALAAYFSAGGSANLAQMVRAALARRHRVGLTFAPPSVVPEVGFFEVTSGRAFANFEDFAAAYFASRPAARGRPWVGVYFSRDTAISGQTELLSAIGAALEARGCNGLFAFGYPPDVALPTLFLEPTGGRRVEAVVALSLKIGNVPAKLAPALAQIDVPILNAIALNRQSRTEWESSTAGLDFLERSWQVGGAELAGAIAPTVVASKERLIDVATGLTYVASMPIPDRVERLADRIQAWLQLRQLKPAAKRVAVVYYNYPPGRESVGASYLNVLPQSLQQILIRLRTEGYAVDGAPDVADELFAAIRTFGSNPAPGPEAAATLDLLAQSGRVPLLPVAEYRVWFDQLPKTLRDQVTGKWGEPEASTIMVWRDPEGRPSFVFPGLRWGNVLFAAQPTRGWDQDIAAAYHDVTLPPHHQYLAFYLWLQKHFKAHAMIHVGTHATHEWLPGKEVGFSAADTGEAIVGAVPQLYPYIVDDIGEGLQAKRRAMATIISHLPPPFDRASLNPELREISGRISDLRVAREKGAVASADILQDLATRCEKVGLFKDLSLTLIPGTLLNDEQIEEIEHHLKKIGEKLTPFGMHTFGVAPLEAHRAATAEGILSLEPGLTPDDHARRKAEIMARLENSARAELDALVAGLAGRHVAAGPGNDPIRNPEALPTGKNFFGFDPSRLPTTATYAAGVRLASDLVAGYRKRHDGQYPDRLVFNLWGTETSRHEGAMEGQILALMGVRPRWDERGRVQGVELIPRSELGRPRVDVTVVPSGLYRDLFPGLMLLLDQAVTAVKTDFDVDNPLLRHIATTRAALEARGLSAMEAERMASVRLFSVPSGAYGTGLDHVIQKEKSWETEQQVAEVFFNRMSHLFGQGYWGARPNQEDKDPALAAEVLRLALKGAKGVIHSRSSNVYGAIDSDDFYQYLGGTALAVRRVNGQAAETLISDLSNPQAGETVTLERYMGRELRARYLNPKWIEAMLKEGYSGARMIRQVTDNLWGWQVTVPDAVDSAKWQEMFETYVQDRYKLGIREKFRAAENLAAYQAIVDRMLAVVEKGYWQAAPETVAALREMQTDLVPAVATENAAIAKRAEAQPAPAFSPAVNGSGKTPASPGPSTATAAAPNQIVRGRVLEEKRRDPPRSTSALVYTFWNPTTAITGVIAGLLIAFGWWRTGQCGDRS